MSLPSLVDSHAHLDAPQFDADRPAVLARAREAGVRRILSIGCLGPRPGIAEGLLALIEGEEGAVAAMGVHPHDARHWSEAAELELRTALDDPRVVALGEIGLDFYYENSPRTEQESAFRHQLEIAVELDLPVIIHTRDAWPETVRILKDFYSGGQPDQGVFHCFGGDAGQAGECLSMGFLMGLGGIVTFKKSEPLRQLVATLPPESFLLETDSPYLAPVPHRGKRNEPAFVARVAEVMAESRGAETAAIAELTSANFDRLIAPRGR